MPSEPRMEDASLGHHQDGPAEPPTHADRASIDRDLIARCRSGDAQAWRTLVQHYRRLVYSVPRRAGLAPEVCDDVFQEVFVILHRKLPSLERESGLPKWIATTARRATLRAIDRRRRESAATDLSERTQGELRPASHDGPDEAVARWETRRLIRESLDDLGERCQQLLEALAHAGERPDYSVIAERFGLPIGSVGPTRARCLAKLLETLRRRGFEDFLAD